VKDQRFKDIYFKSVREIVYISKNQKTSISAEETKKKKQPMVFGKHKENFKI